jgi:hypothetical protein
MLSPAGTTLGEKETQIHRQRQLINIEQKIIKEGNLRFETNDLKATYT